MSEPIASQSEETENQSSEVVIVQQKRHPLARLGCGLLLVAWFTLLLTPCALFYLAANGEIRIWHSDIPDSYSHPRLLIKLISEVDYRGVSVTNSSVVETNLDDTAICVQTNVRYFLWETINDSPDATYCDCYTREDIDSTWGLTETTPGVCVTKP